MMTKFAHRLLLLVSLVVLATLVAAPAFAQEPKILTTAVGPGDPRSLDPQRAIDTKDWGLLNPLFPALHTLNEETGQIAPGLAQSWDLSEDGLTYTFHLIPEVPWVRYNADTQAVEQVLDDAGNPRYVTASDVVFGFTRALDPATGSAGAYMLAPVIAGGAEFNSGEGSAEDLQIAAVDDYTFQVTAPEKLGYSLGLYGILNARPTPQWAIEEGGDAWIEPENIQTYGPFALAEWAHESHLTYVKNPFWPGSEGYGQAIVDQLVIRFLDESVQIREYEAGNLDVTNTVPGDQFERIQADPVLSQELHVAPGACTEVWGFNTLLAPFDNVHIRRAFNFAVDRESLVNNVVKGGRIPSRWYTPPGVANGPTLEEYPDLGVSFDPERAVEELNLGLADLGLSSAAELPPITMVYGNSELLNGIGQALQIMWNETLGVTVTLNPLDPTTYWATMEVDAGQIFRGGWCPDYNDANNYTRDVLRSDGIYNYGRWNSPEFDAIVDQAATETDPQVRQELYAQAEQLITVGEAAQIPLYWNSIPTLTKPYVSRTYSSNNIESYWKWDVNR